MKPTGIHIAGELKGCSPEVINSREKVEELVRSGITESGMTVVNVTSHEFEPLGLTVAAIISESHVVIHTYPEAEHASVDIYTCSFDHKPPEQLFEYIRAGFKAKRVKHTTFFRGDILDKKDSNLITTSAGNGFEIRYEVDNIICSMKTGFQQLDIIENTLFGRMLFLDNDMQIADSDASIYNEAMISPVRKIPKIKNALILGGGDGGIANQLLQEADCSITLVDIDPAVIEACREHLPLITGNVFQDNRVKVLNRDALNFLEEKDQVYDAIFYDLSMNPEVFSIKDKRTYLSELFLLLKKNLTEEGVLTMQCCSAYDEDLLNIIKDILPRFFPGPDFKEVMIPSFCEPWVFASVNGNN